MNTSGIFPGLVVRLAPSPLTLSRHNFVPNIEPCIGGIYRVERLNSEGLVYLESNAGPFLQEDLVPAIADEMHNVKRVSRELDQRRALIGAGIDIPRLKSGDRVVCTATWATPEIARSQGWPLQNEIQVVDSVEDDGLYFRLKGFRDRFPSWHFRRQD